MLLLLLLLVVGMIVVAATMLVVDDDRRRRTDTELGDGPGAWTDREAWPAPGEPSPWGYGRPVPGFRTDRPQHGLS